MTNFTNVVEVIMRAFSAQILFIFLLGLIIHTISGIGIRNPARINRKRNFFLMFCIVLTIVYAVNLYTSWAEHVDSLSKLDQYILLTLVFLLLASVFSLGLYITYVTNGLIVRSDVDTLLKNRFTDELNERLADSKTTISCLKSVKKKAKTNTTSITEINDKQQDSIYDKYWKATSTLQNSFTRFIEIKVGSEILLIRQMQIDSTRGSTGPLYDMFLLKKPTEFRILYDHSIQGKEALSCNELLGSFFENNHLKTPLEIILDRMIENETIFQEGLIKGKADKTVPLHLVWYYVIIFMLGTKIDYFTPINLWSKVIVLLMAAYRFIILGQFLTIAMHDKP